MDGWRVLAGWLLALVLALWLTPRMIQLSERVGLMDWPNERKPHSRATPLLGGAAMFLAVLVAGVLCAFPGDAVGRIGWPVVAGGALAFGVGLLDDYMKSRHRNLAVLPKLVLQFVPAGLLALSGVQVNYLSKLGGGYIFLPDWVDIPLTIIWVVGMTNAINFIDGLDGLAAGVVSVATFTLTMVALALSQFAAATWVAALLGACLGFLRFNFPPARIFMGDAGSNFLGFMLAAVSLTGYFKTATLAGVVVPLFALSLPVLNGVFVVLRRLILRRPIHQADREHSFDVLKRRGFNTMETVLIFLLLAMALSAAGMGIALRP